jgi:hypothetical protein
MATNPDNFPNEPVCGLANTALNLQLKNPSMSFASLPRGIFLWTTDNPPRWAAVRVTSVSNVGALGGDCAAGPSTPTRPLLTLATSCTGSGFGNALVPNCTMNGVLGVGLGDIVRYDVRVDPADNVPSLWRSHPLLGDPAKDVLVARGIEDLQVEYIQANMPGVCDAANPCANAPLVSLTMPPPNPNTDYNTIITQVQVTLSARSNVQGLQGQTKVGGQAWLRGSLTSVGSPRAALYALNMQQPLPPGTPPLWQ